MKLAVVETSKKSAPADAYGARSDGVLLRVVSEVTPAAVTSVNVTEAPSPRSTSTPAPVGVFVVPATTVQLRLAGVASTFSSASVAKTSNVWGPAESPTYSMPLSQSSSAPPSSEHSNVMSTGAVRLSVALKTKVAEVLVVVAPSASARSIAVSGASASGASIVHWYSTGSSTVVIPSSGSVVARTSNTCWPFVRPAYSCGDVHGSHGVGTGSSTGSRRHSYVEPGWSKNSKVASGLVLSSSGATVICVA